MIYKHQHFQINTDTRAVFDENNKQLRLTGNSYRVLVFLCVNKSGTVTDIGTFLDWAKDYDENHLRQYRYKINTIIGHDVISYQNGIYSLVGSVEESKKLKESERNTDLLQVDDVQSSMNHKGTIMGKKSLIIRVISIGVLAIVIIGSIFYIIFKTTKREANSNQKTTQNISKTEQENSNTIYIEFLSKEFLADLEFKAMNWGIYTEDATLDCPEQEEYDQLKGKEWGKLSKQELERVISLHPKCGYRKIIQKERALDELNSHISELFGILPKISNVDKKALAQKIADDWRKVANLVNEDYRNQRLIADSNTTMWSILLDYKLKNINDNDAAGEMDKISNQLSKLTSRKQEIKSETDSIVMGINDAMAQFKVGVEINNSNTEDNSSVLEKQEKCKQDALSYRDSELKRVNDPEFNIINLNYVFSSKLDACLYSVITSYNQGDARVTLEWIIMDLSTNKQLAYYASDFLTGKILFGDKNDYEQKQMEYFGAWVTD